MSTTATIIGPADEGRRMSLDEFIDARGEGGRLYELSRGIVSTVDEPNPRLLMTVNAVRNQLMRPRQPHPDCIHMIASIGECRLLIKDLESDRHPDLAVYKTPPPDSENADEIWSQWIPEIVIEVVSPSSRFRDYQQKPEEYLRFGVHEYWIVDVADEAMKVLRRSGGQWAEWTLKAPETHKTRLLPGLEFSIAAMFEAK
ncbi:MAG: Uma2 family endonuclease [Paludisphaera borealis]|uniref:Uma2 family endonuclease n=1 Tax=Paludisphaera borealis TaxID=1387353 RepID=UPI00283DC8D9|nr:Uma2 family endonuclease [Paludisphaera borealis]MDR3622734.1 Uma2 family endonuclease [Paludisphaera borealis]